LTFPSQQYQNLRNSPEAEDTRLKVQAFAKFTITDNNIAKFKNRKTKAIGILYRRLFIIFSTVINGIEQVAMKRL
jgi:hypothetical protein